MKLHLTAVALALTFIANPLSAEIPKVFACQYTEATGFIFQQRQWEPTGFQVSQPFFLKTNGTEVINPSVLLTKSTSCSVYQTHHHQCVDGIGTTLYLNTSTKTGAVSHLFGAGQSDNDRDTVSIQMFVCETL